MRGRPTHARAFLLISIAAAAACGDRALEGDEDLGPVEQIVPFADRVSWPGIDRADLREVPLIHAFADQAPTDYWFLGYASPATSDSYWLCREDAPDCPLDAHRRIAWDHLVGGPIFAAIPGRPGYSPFSRMWKVTVGPSFDPDSAKSVETLQRLVESAVVQLEPVTLAFGDPDGTAGALVHAPLVLTGTELADNGTVLADLETPMMPVARARGWYTGYRVELFDLTVAEGVFPSAMPAAPLYALWRDCSADPPPPRCEAATSDRVVVRGPDPSDTNGVLAALPSSAPGLRYSPLLAVEQVVVVPERDGDVVLVDDSGDPRRSDVTSVDDITRLVDAGSLTGPVPQRVDDSGNPLPGGADRLYYDVATPVAETFVPYP